MIINKFVPLGIVTNGTNCVKFSIDSNLNQKSIDEKKRKSEKK